MQTVAHDPKLQGIRVDPLDRTYGLHRIRNAEWPSAWQPCRSTSSSMGCTWITWQRKAGAATPTAAAAEAALAPGDRELPGVKSAGRAREWGGGRPSELGRTFGLATAAARSRMGLNRAASQPAPGSAVPLNIEALQSGDFRIVSQREEAEALEAGFE
jgi:hypothetical protein